MTRRAAVGEILGWDNPVIPGRGVIPGEVPGWEDRFGTVGGRGGVDIGIVA